LGFRFSIYDSEMNENEMRARTKDFTLRILKLVDAIPATRAGNAVANQLVRSGSSVGANFRALCRAKSRADFIHKTSVVEEEADETGFWLEITIDGELLPATRVQPLLAEADALTAIMVASRRTARANSSDRKSKIENRK
jgi:four helix bundle protein